MIPAVATLALAGSADAKGLFDDVKKIFSGPQAPTTHLESFKAESDLQQPCGGDGEKTLLNARVEQGLGTVEEAELSAYLNAIAAKLIAVSPRPHCRVSVHVTPHDSVEAVALNDGGILIARGFLRNLKNEDEVAALLAHELSHILRNHHGSDSFVATQDEFLKGMDAANTVGSMFAGILDPRIEAGLETVTAVGTAMHGVSEGLIAPAWTRDQEDEADLLGSDLLSVAGYNPRAMAAIMDVIAAHEAANAEVDAVREKLREERLQKAAVQTVQGIATSNPLVIVGSLAKVVTAVADSVAAGQKQHRPAAERKKNINKYVRKFHRRARRRSFVTGPWNTILTAGTSAAMLERYRAASEARRLVVRGGDLVEARSLAKSSLAGAYAAHAYPRLAHSEVLMGQGDWQGAAKSLRVALERRDAPWQVYRALADLQIKTADLAGATATVAAADRVFGEPLGIAPYAIKVYRAAGDQKKVNAYLDRCHEAGKREHLARCLAESGQTAEQYQRARLMRGGPPAGGQATIRQPDGR